MLTQSECLRAIAISLSHSEIFALGEVGPSVQEKSLKRKLLYYFFSQRQVGKDLPLLLCNTLILSKQT